MPKINKNGLDVTRVFLTYTLFVGDVEKTSAALDLNPEIVRGLASQEGWDEKLKRVCLLSKTGRPGDWERAQNRAMCFVQAHQLRELLDRVIAQFEGKTPDEVVEMIATVAKDGSRHISAKFFSDLAAAVEKTHQMTYSALGDTLTERSERESPDEDQLNATALHAAVTSALNNPSAKCVEVGLSLRKTLPQPAEEDSK